MSYHLQVLENSLVVFSGELETRLELGRQQRPEESLYSLHPLENGSRLAIAPLDETRIGRHQLAIRPESHSAVLVTNLSQKVVVEVLGGSRLETSAEQLLNVPVTILLPAGRTISISSEIQSKRLQSLGEMTIAPGQAREALSALTLGRSSWQPTPQTEQLVQALQATMDVFQSANRAEELFDSAARGAVRLAGFDRAQVLLYESGTWRTVCKTAQLEEKTWPVSQTVLKSVFDQKRTFWDTEGSTMTEAASLLGVDAVIAAPILRTDGEIIGALYGDRRQQLSSMGRMITRLDARLIELLACGVASGLSRMEQQETARRLQFQFEQFFTPELARELELHPDLLEGRDAEVSILFCDIRGFSRISERIGTQATFEWINHLMGALSECVTRYQGVLVDYIGDELMAMWGAPQVQTNHAELACRAAIDMLGILPQLNDRWQQEVGEVIDLGIGINSGLVRAGNAGSKRKFKYSPLGNTVNLASRVQGATKFLKTRLLVTGHTSDQLNPSFVRRRLASVKVVNIHEPVSLWELALAENEHRDQLCSSYAQALSAFEGGQFHQAAQTLSEILSIWPNDGPSLILLKRTVNALADGPTLEHPVWILGGK